MAPPDVVGCDPVPTASTQVTSNPQSIAIDLHDLSDTLADTQSESDVLPQAMVNQHSPAHTAEKTTLLSCDAHDNDHTDVKEGIVDQSRMEHRPWKATWLRWGPMSGLLCIFASVCSIFAALTVLLVSNNSPTDDWPLEPASYLSAFNAVIQQTLRIAVVQGVIITWWSKALKGTTLQDLHYEYEWLNGLPAWSAFRNGYRLTLIGMACVASALVAVDGPLLQKASSVIATPISNHPVDLNVSISPEIPRGLSGWWFRTNATSTVSGARGDDYYADHIPTTTGTTPNNIRPVNAGEGVLMRNYITDQPITGFVTGCPGSCRAKVLAPAVQISASKSHSINVDYKTPYDTYDAPFAFLPHRLSFFVTLDLLTDGQQERLNLVTGHAALQNCAGVFNYTIWNLEAAIGEYTVTIVNGTAIPKDLGDPRIVAVTNNTNIEKGFPVAHHQNQVWHDSTLINIVELVSMKYKTAVLIGSNEVDGVYMSTFDTTPNACIPFISDATNNTCWSFIDPAPIVIRDINSLMFRAGVWAAGKWNSSTLEQTLDPGLEANNIVIGELLALVEVICISLILPTYVGWWRIGRPISFSPLEIAKAFEAPLLSEYNSNSTGKDIAKTGGDVNVRYGALEIAPNQQETANSSHERKLVFANPQMVYSPLSAFKFNS